MRHSCARFSSTIRLSASCSAILVCSSHLSFLFFFNDTATTEIYTLSLHDALPILPWRWLPRYIFTASQIRCSLTSARSEEHTSELQSLTNLVCRLLLEKKNTTTVMERSIDNKYNDALKHGAYTASP